LIIFGFPSILLFHLMTRRFFPPMVFHTRKGMYKYIIVRTGVSSVYASTYGQQENVNITACRKTWG